jgi:cytochrome c oxidase cbb3-type subunit 1
VVESTLEQKYDYAVVRWFAVLAVIYVVVGALVGVLIASQLAWPVMNFDIQYLTFGRMRPPH